MRPKKSENEENQLELGRVRLVTFINMSHELVHLGNTMDWEGFNKRFGDKFHQTRGRPALSTRLAVGLTYLKYLYNLSDEGVVTRFICDPYVQYFCGFEYFQHESPCDSSSLTNWRKKIGEDGAEKFLTETLSVAHKLGLIKLSDCERVILDTTVQEKNITFPTDAKLINKARENLVKEAKKEGIKLRQTYTFKGKRESHRCSRLLHGKQFNRAKSSIKKQKTYLGRVIRDIRRKSELPSEKLQTALNHGTKILFQERHSENKIYSLHEPKVDCISKGKARTPYEFGNKVSFTITARNNWIIGAMSFFKNPYDGATLKEAVKQTERLTGKFIKDIYVDKGYRGRVHHPEGKQVILSGRKGLLPVHKKYLRRRSSIEPVIGHMKHDHRMEVNLLKGIEGDKFNPLLAASAFNMRKILRSFFLCFFYWLPKIKMELKVHQLHQSNA